MADDPSKSAPSDKINVNQPADVSFWAQKWGVTETNVKAAVKIVGPSVAAVQKYLKK